MKPRYPVSVLAKAKRLAIYLLSREMRRTDFVAAAPRPQNALDIFRGEWISQLPDEVSGPIPGALPLFNDARVDWGLDALGGVEGQSVLELGPLEAGHTYMLHRRGAASVLGIEANPQSYLKCLVVKEVLALERARFLCGDFLPFLRESAMTFDLCLASGVLYHIENPVELLAHLARVTDRLYLWTHYYDGERIARNERCRGRFADGVPATYEGFPHTLHRFAYRTARLFGAFTGGRHAWSHWLKREDIVEACRHFGFDRIEIAFEEPDHANGPCLALAASRSEPRVNRVPR